MQNYVKRGIIESNKNPGRDDMLIIATIIWTLAMQIIGMTIPLALVIIIMCTGIVILLSAVGLKGPKKLGSTIVDKGKRAIKGLGKSVLKIFKQLVHWIPKFFKSIRDRLIQKGVAEKTAEVIAGLVTALVII